MQTSLPECLFNQPRPVLDCHNHSSNVNEVVCLVGYPIRFCIVDSERTIYRDVLRLDGAQVYPYHCRARILFCKLYSPL